MGFRTYQTAGSVTMALASPGGYSRINNGPFRGLEMLTPTLSRRSRIRIVAYNQIGNGHSTHLRDAPKEFWTPEHFMNELDNLLSHLGHLRVFRSRMLAEQYAATHTPKGLRCLVIFNSPASMELYEVGTNALLKKFPPDFIAISKEYEDGMMVFMKKHVYVMASFESFGKNPSVYHTMLGPSELNVTRTLKICAPNDEVQDVAVMPWFLRDPEIKWLELANSTHLGLYEEKDRYLHVLKQFLEASG
ncbi:hypothetical protein F5146DRAFT_1112216 [Armillaria mellea]|nr:hypothetical protein F5146DRAFT_1112216 [Armillaria mellea]